MATNREPRPFHMGIPYEVLRRISLTFGEGKIKYDPDAWERFYQTRSTPEDFLEYFDHAIEHIYKAYDEMVTGRIHDGAEDQLAHAIVNLCMIAWAQENNKLPNKMQSLISGNSALAPTYEDNGVEEVLPAKELTLVDKIVQSFRKAGTA